MSEKKDPLADLLSSDAQAEDRAQLATLVKPFLIIDRASKEFTFLPAFFAIEGNAGKLEVLLAGTKARSLLLSEPEGLVPTEIIALSIMPTGSVKTSLKTLFDAHKIKKGKDGRYFIPGYRIPELVKQFANKS